MINTPVLSATFSIEGLHLVTNVQMLKIIPSTVKEELYSLALIFLDRFPTMRFLTKATPIIQFVIVEVLVLQRLNETILTGHTGTIHVNTLRNRHTPT